MRKLLDSLHVIALFLAVLVSIGMWFGERKRRESAEIEMRLYKSELERVKLQLHYQQKS